ncbi:MAG TPA: glycosyltransferase family 39 protein [Thermoanaerobaculia bacterium]|jgi:hypothetical protein
MNRVVLLLAAIAFAFHEATAKLYGFFIDEIYFLACGQHLAWGYVDMPPLTAFQAWLTRHLFGDSAYAIRLFPSLAAAGIVLLAAAIARELGGGKFAQSVAALVALLSPGYLATCSYLCMNSIEPLVWGGAALVVIRIINTGNTRLWPWFGVLGGIGLLNKHTMLVFGFAVVVSLLVTDDRRLMFNRWFVLAGVIAFAIVFPNLLWEIGHGFPHIEMLENIKRNGRDVKMNPVVFLLWDVLLLNPMAAPLWIAGLVSLLYGSLKRYRAIGLTWLVALTVLLLANGRFYYLLPAFVMLIGAGGVAVERTSESRRWLRATYVPAIVIVGLVIAPIGVPVLPPNAYFAYTKFMHIQQPKFEHRRTTSMPQFFADRFGWPEMVATVARAYFSLPPDVRAKTGIFGNDYGQAGAIDFYGPQYGLPKSIGGHLSYWFWGPRQYTGDSLLVLGDDRKTLEEKFEVVKPMAEIGHPYAMAQEHFTLFWVQKPRGFTLQSAWPQLKHWD